MLSFLQRDDNIFARNENIGKNMPAHNILNADRMYLEKLEDSLQIYYSALVKAKMIRNMLEIEMKTISKILLCFINHFSMPVKLFRTPFINNADAAFIILQT